MDTKEKETIELVIPEAMDLDLGHVSVASPLGSALVDKKVGQVTEARLPIGKRRLKVLELKTLHDQTREELERDYRYLIRLFERIILLIPESYRKIIK